MSNNKNDIFQSLTDKLEEKEFQFEAAHWEAAQKMITPKANFWSPKLVAAVGSAIVITGFVGYNFLSEEKINNDVIVETVIETPIQHEIEKEIVIEKIITTEINNDIIVAPTKVEVKKEIEKEEEELHIVKDEILKVEIVPSEKNDIKVDDEGMTEEEFVEFIDDNLQNNPTPIIKIVDNKLVAVTPIIPNIFTPNNDGVNDFFSIKNIDKGEWGLLIYNQPGEVVFESTQYDNKWDGENVANGTYIFKLYNKETNYQSSGLVELKR